MSNSRSCSMDLACSGVSFAFSQEGQLAVILKKKDKPVSDKKDEHDSVN